MSLANWCDACMAAARRVPYGNLVIIQHSLNLDSNNEEHHLAVSIIQLGASALWYMVTTLQRLVLLMD